MHLAHLLLLEKVATDHQCLPALQCQGVHPYGGLESLIG